ncbi:MAG: hypothetical protein CTY28_14435 [Hyphomicrobium sp.]|nr:MAG: hypothetical protein CTY28_14435 [Hyphomicrobium sp.]
MDAKAAEQIRVRLMLLEALVVMSVSLRYVDRHTADPTLDIWRMVSRDVRSWFDQLATEEAFDSVTLEAESARLMSEIEKHVNRAAGPPPYAGV